MNIYLCLPLRRQPISIFIRRTANEDMSLLRVISTFREGLIVAANAVSSWIGYEDETLVLPNYNAYLVLRGDYRNEHS